MQRLRLASSFAFTLLFGVVMVAACANDDGASSSVETPSPSAPATDVEGIAATVVREVLAAIPTPTPAPVPDIESIVETVLARTMDARLEALLTAGSIGTETIEDGELSSELGSNPEPRGSVVEPQVMRAPAFSSVLLRDSGTLSNAQELSEPGGFTVTAHGSVTVSADAAHVVVVHEQFYGPGGPEKLSHDDRDDVVQNLTDIGIGEDVIVFGLGQPYGPESVSVEVQIDELPEVGDLILDAVEDVIRISERSGVRFSVLGENCDNAVEAARQEAIAQAEGDSFDLAEALGVVRAGIIFAVETPDSSFSAEFASSDKCGGGQFDPYRTPLVLFDTEPEVEVSLRMEVTYGPRSARMGGLTATAVGSMKAPADTAYVVVVPELFYGPAGLQAFSTEDRADVIEALGQVGITTDNIEIISGRQPYEPVLISVRVAVEDLPDIGHLILDAVEDVIRRSESNGVRFGLSDENCDRAVALARLDAISQIDRKVGDLASTLGITRGAVVGAVEETPSLFAYGLPRIDICGGLFGDPYALKSFDAEPSVDVVLQLQATFAPQSDETAGLVAVGSSSLTVEADEAYVVVVPQRYGALGPEPLSSEERADVMDKLTAIGIASNDIEIVSGRRPYELDRLSVEVAVAELPDIGERIVNTVEEALRRSENSGVRFGLSEEACNDSLALARRDAASQADRESNGLAGAIGVVRGGVVSAVEHSLGFEYGSAIIETCGGQFQDPDALAPFDAEPKIEVAVGLQLGYSISR